MVARTPKPVERYNKLIGAYDAEFKKWEARAKKIIKRYRDERTVSNDSTAKFNILWSNVTTLIPAVFARLPQPDVSRRHKDNDPVGRVAALLLERGLEYELQHYSDYAAALKNVVQDRFLGGRGIAWVRYEPHIEEMDSVETDDGPQVTEDAEDEGAELNEYLDTECTPVDYVAWSDFGHEVARTWEEVNVVWRRVYMGRSALIERFGDEYGTKIPLDTKPPELKKSDGESASQALIYEIWDKSENKALWYSKSLGEILDERVPGDDSLPRLEGFWPCPRPLYATTTTDSLIPIPDFSLYQDQARTLDLLAERIDELIKALRVRGVYDASSPELGRVFTEGANNNLIPVKNWNAFAEKQGLKGSIELVDIVPFAQALEYCYKAVDQVKQQIYEITHISDILRGATDPNETLGAQQMKGQYASMPLKEMQREVEQFASALIQIKAQIMCAQYSDETLIKIGGAQELTPEDQQLVPQALQLLRDKPMRNFRIEVATDSLVQMDEIREKQERTELLTSFGSFIKEAIPAAQASPQLAPVLLEMLKFTVAAYKAGRTMEGVIDQAADQLKQLAANPPPQPPDPKLLAIQAQTQAKQQEMQAGLQIDQQRLAMEDQQAQREQAYQAQQVAAQQQLEAQREAMQQQHEKELEAFRAANDAHLQQMQQQAEAQTQLILQAMKDRIALEVAEIGAKTTLDAAQVSAAKQGAEE
jgi:hypothetical protein